MRRDTFTLMLTRDGTRRGAPVHPAEWLTGRCDADSVRAEAQALVDDPRDTITLVSLWNDKLQQFDARVIRRSTT